MLGQCTVHCVYHPCCRYGVVLLLSASVLTVVLGLAGGKLCCVHCSLFTLVTVKQSQTYQDCKDYRLDYKLVMTVTSLICIRSPVTCHDHHR